MNLFHLMQLRSALKLEIRTGMRFSNRGSVNATAARVLGLSGRPQKLTVLAALERAIADIEAGEVRDTGPKVVSQV